jgi:hypothetical protein
MLCCVLCCGAGGGSGGGSQAGAAAGLGDDCVCSIPFLLCYGMLSCGADGESGEADKQVRLLV